MRTHGFNPSEEDLRDMIRNVDKNANGAIDFNEFIEMMLKQGSWRWQGLNQSFENHYLGVNSDEDAAHAFKVFDRGENLLLKLLTKWPSFDFPDGDGLITAEELRYSKMSNFDLNLANIEPVLQSQLSSATKFRIFLSLDLQWTTLVSPWQRQNSMQWLLKQTRMGTEK